MNLSVPAPFSSIGATAASRPTSPTSAAVVGGGISGLALGIWLRRRGVSVSVFERADRPGGVIGSVRMGEFIFERGPSTLLDKSDHLHEMIELVGLQNEVRGAALRDYRRYIWHGGRLHPLASNPVGLIGSKLLTPRAKLRALREPWVASVPSDEPLADFITRRLGSEIHERMFVPMVSGIWAGDTTQMSTAASFPILKELESKSGSLIRGMIRKAREERKRRGGEPRRQTRLLSFQGGLDRLPSAMADDLGQAFCPNKRIQAIEPQADGFGLHVAGSDGTYLDRTRHLALGVEAPEAANLIEPFEPDLAERLRAVSYSPLAAVGLGVEKTSLRLPPGFGFLVAREQGLRILGAIFNSNMLPDRAPAGCATITVMVGGDLDPRGATLDDDELLGLIRHDLGAALGWDGHLQCRHIQRWPRAIPRYAMDHAALIDGIEKAERRHPGLHFFGNWAGGTAIPARIDLAHQLASRIEAQIHAGVSA